MLKLYEIVKKLDEINITSSRAWVARFIHNSLNKNQLPVSWTYPEMDEPGEGAQVLRIGEALDIIYYGEHKSDDWFHAGQYNYLAFLRVSGFSGHSRLGYQAVTEDDVKEMWAVPTNNIKMQIEQIGMEMHDDGYPIKIKNGRLTPEWNVDFGFEEEGEFLNRLLNNHGEKVTPEFVETV